MKWWKISNPQARAEAEGYNCAKRCVGSINFPGYPPRPNQEHFDKGYAKGLAEIREKLAV